MMLADAAVIAADEAERFAIIVESGDVRQARGRAIAACEMRWRLGQRCSCAAHDEPEYRR